MSRVMLVAALVSAGCMGSNRVPERQRDGVLPLAAVTVQESGSTLELTGITAAGAKVAHLKLFQGPFTMAEDGRAVDGRRLDVDVLGQATHHESEGYRQLQLPFPAARVELSEFLLDPRVRAALDRWGLGFDESTIPTLVSGTVAPAEIAFYGCTYATTDTCNASSCAETVFQGPSDTGCAAHASQQFVCCGNTAKQYAQRFCGYTGTGYANPCGAEGPNGCASCWTGNYNSTCAASSGGGNVNHSCDEWPWQSPATYLYIDGSTTYVF